MYKQSMLGWCDFGERSQTLRILSDPGDLPVGRVLHVRDTCTSWCVTAAPHLAAEGGSTLFPVRRVLRHASAFAGKVALRVKRELQ